MDNIKLPLETVKEIVTRGAQVEQDFSVLRQNYEKYRQMYFMNHNFKPRNAEVDANDWKVTPSPSARNEVIGSKRLLDTSELGVNVLEGDKTSQNSNKIERGLKRIIEVSGEGKRARILSDATLASSLYGPVILTVDFYDDILKTKLPDYAKKHNEKQAKKSPAVVSVINAEECSFEYDGGLLLHFQRKYKLRGAQVKSRHGELPGKPIKDSQEYIIRDIYTPEYRVIEAEGYGTLMAKAHGLNCIPVAIGFSGGSELFYKPEEQINPFLYAKMKSGLWERETSALTAMATSVSMRGLLGPAVFLEANSKMFVDYVGGMRVYSTEGGGKMTPIDDKVIDPVIFQLLNKYDELSGQSTIYKQTLGENIGAGTFSGLAMLSSAGKLPLVDAQRALQQAFEDMFDHILYRIKSGGIVNKLIEAADIPEQYELEVTFKPKLPQDDLRNAQIVSTLQGLVSKEYIHGIMQVDDSQAMQKQITKEQIYDAIVMGITQNPQFMQGLVMQVIGQGQPTQPTQPTQSTETPPQPNMEPEMQDPVAQAQGQPNMEQTPKTDPMIPPEERM